VVLISSACGEDSVPSELPDVCFAGAGFDDAGLFEVALVDGDFGEVDLGFDLDCVADSTGASPVGWLGTQADEAMTNEMKKVAQ